MRIFIVILSFLIPIIHQFAAAQSFNTQTKLYEVWELKEDFNFWRTKLEDKQPLLYLYTPKNQLDNYFDSMFSEIKEPMSELSFIKHLLPINAIIKDGHGYVVPSKNSIKTIREQARLLPMDLYFLGNKLYVLKNLALEFPQLDRAEILSINDIKSSDIQRLMLSNLSGEGNNKNHALASINNSFRFYFHLLFGFSDEFRIVFKNPVYSDSICIIKAESLENIQKHSLGKYKPNTTVSPTGLQFRIHDSTSTAILGIKTFSPNSTKRRFKKEISNHFTFIENSNITNLIIDLRGNNGGNPYLVTYILKYLFNKPFIQATECRVVKNRRMEVFYNRTKYKWYPRYGIGEFNPRKNNFKGKLFVLIDEGTFSSGVIFASVLKKYDRATFIGRETGGNPVIMSGYLIKTSWELPNTKVQYGHGTLCTLYDDLNKNQGMGLKPDLIIEDDPKDHFSTYDRILDYTLQLINRPN